MQVASLVPEQIRQAATTVAEREAQVKQAEAQLAQADLNLSYTEIRAPSDGFVTRRSVQLGDYLTAGATMFLIVTPDVWVDRGLDPDRPLPLGLSVSPVVHLP